MNNSSTGINWDEFDWNEINTSSYTISFDPPEDPKKQAFKDAQKLLSECGFIVNMENVLIVARFLLE